MRDYDLEHPLILIGSDVKSVTIWGWLSAAFNFLEVKRHGIEIEKIHAENINKLLDVFFVHGVPVCGLRFVDVLCSWVSCPSRNPISYMARIEEKAIPSATRRDKMIKNVLSMDMVINQKETRGNK